MSYTINNYNGAILTVVSDGTINTALDLILPGKEYAGYGEIQNENFVYLLENFAGTTAPAKPIPGQYWYDTATNKMKFYDKRLEWRASDGVQVSATPPVGFAIGDLWMDTTTSQLLIWNGEIWVLVGPQAVAGAGVTQMVSTKVYDTVGNWHAVIIAYVDGQAVHIISSDDEFTLDDDLNPILGFNKIHQGLTLAYTNDPEFEGETQSNHRYWGTASDSERLGGVWHAEYPRLFHAEFYYDPSKWPTAGLIETPPLPPVSFPKMGFELRNMDLKRGSGSDDVETDWDRRTVGRVLVDTNGHLNIKNMFQSKIIFTTTDQQPDGDNYTYTQYVPVEFTLDTIQPGVDRATDIGSITRRFGNIYSGVVEADLSADQGQFRAYGQTTESDPWYGISLKNDGQYGSLMSTNSAVSRTLVESATNQFEPVKWNLVTGAVTLSGDVTFTSPLTAPAFYGTSKDHGIGQFNAVSVVARGPVSAAAVTNAGSAYTDSTYANVTLQGAVDGSNAEFTITIASGAITTAVLTSGGSNFIAGETIDVPGALVGGTGSGGVITVTSITPMWTMTGMYNTGQQSGLGQATSETSLDLVKDNTATIRPLYWDLLSGKIYLDSDEKGIRIGANIESTEGSYNIISRLGATAVYGKTGWTSSWTGTNISDYTFVSKFETVVNDNSDYDAISAMNFSSKAPISFAVTSTTSHVYLNGQVKIKDQTTANYVNLDYNYAAHQLTFQQTDPSVTYTLDFGTNVFDIYSAGIRAFTTPPNFWHTKYSWVTVPDTTPTWIWGWVSPVSPPSIGVDVLEFKLYEPSKFSVASAINATNAANVAIGGVNKSIGDGNVSTAPLRVIGTANGTDFTTFVHYPGGVRYSGSVNLEPDGVGSNRYYGGSYVIYTDGSSTQSVRVISFDGVPSDGKFQWRVPSVADGHAPLSYGYITATIDNFGAYDDTALFGMISARPGDNYAGTDREAYDIDVMRKNGASFERPNLFSATITIWFPTGSFAVS